MKNIIILMFLTGCCLLTNGQTSCSDLYNQYKANKSDDQIRRTFLLSVPEYLQTLEGSMYERWSIRAEDVYKEYRKQKPLAEWMNPTDFAILTTYHQEPVIDDEVLAFLKTNKQEVMDKVGKKLLYQYMFTLNTLVIENMARKGDKRYLELVEEINGEMNDVYTEFMDFKNIDVYTGMKYLYDGVYYLYNKRDMDKYVSLMEEYFSKLSGDDISTEYILAVQTLYEATDGKLNAKMTQQSINWLTKALHGDVEEMKRMELLLMLGDCYKWQKNYAEAKKAFSQAYLLSLQFNNAGLSNRVKAYAADIENM
ncbi:MAG: hypothetical protein ACRDDZ_00860 [Marinifilaceae bacterium]